MEADMNKPETDAAPAPEWTAALAHPELQEITYLRRALEIADEDGLGVARADVERVEAMWTIDDGDWNALGFVLLLQDGRRVYLDYVFDFAENEEEIDLHPMGSERYPTI
jgi:hypothetical protein